MAHSAETPTVSLTSTKSERLEMRQHAKHLLMCSPMIVLAIVLIALGGGVGILLPVLGCVVMMGAMMLGMGMLGRQARRDRS